jgi:hypothetical protein
MNSLKLYAQPTFQQAGLLFGRPLHLHHKGSIRQGISQVFETG